MKRHLLLALVLATASTRTIQAQQADVYPAKQACRFVRHTWVPMRDGTRLAASLFLPLKEGRYPVVLQRTPYNRQNLLGGSATWAQGGYVFISQDVRGRHDSEGKFDPLLQEIADTPDTIAWIRQQPWCDGRVGMMGPSYLALVQYFGVAHGSGPNPDALVPTFASGDAWQRGFYNRGPLSLFLTYGWLNFDVGGRTGQGNTMLHYDMAKVMRHLPLTTLDTVDGSVENQVWREWLAHPSYDAYWKRYSVRGTYDRFTMPTLQVAGWYDYYPAETIGQWQQMVAAAKTPQIAAGHRLLIGPWGHNHGLEPTSDGHRAVDFGPDAAFNANRIYREWFDRTFRGIKKKGAGDDPPIRLFVMGRNQWRDEKEWPLARARSVRYYLHSGGKANTLQGDGRLNEQPPAEDEAVDRFTYDPAHPVPTRGGNHSVGPWNDAYKNLIWCGPCDQTPNEKRADVLVYTGEPLAEELEVTGPIVLHLRAASSAPDTDFVARLVDVHPDGKAINITEGVVRARYRGKDVSRPQFLEPNQPADFTIDLQCTSNVFLKGHRVRLDITSSNFPLWDRNLNTGEDPNRSTVMRPAQQTIYHTRAHPGVLVLPVVPNQP